MKNILYVRSGPFKVNIQGYNIQVIGLCKQLIKKGYNCDIMFIDDYDHEEIFDKCEETGCVLRIVYRKGIKIFLTGIYPQILKRKYLEKYDIVICTEYNQIMTPLISRLHNNVSMYSGPYYSTFSKSIFSPIYDFLFRRTINKNIKHKIVKSELAKEYLGKKGYKNLEVMGVGLDTDKFSESVKMSSTTQQIVDILKREPCILYVGSIDRRKNVKFLMEAFKKVLERDPSLKMLIIGKGTQEYKEECLSPLSKEMRDNIYWFQDVQNSEMKFIFPEAKVFVLPSINEIFGMVLLEAMYLGCPVVTSYNGGSSTLIENESQGFVLKDFDCNLWADRIYGLIQNEELRSKIIVNAHKRISENFLWDKLSEQLLEIIGEK